MTDNGRLTWINDKRLLSDLIPWPRNPRQVKVEQVKRLQESLTEFGQPETIAIGPGNELYNGHQRLKSWADKFGDIEVDVRVADRALTEKEREKLTIFLHKGAAGEWDFDTLANEFDVDDLLDWGFDDHELDLDLWGVEPEEDPGAQIDRAEELREKWSVETGQLWRLGEHRLIVGDCTDAEVVERVMDGERAELCFTSPPYADQRDYTNDGDLSPEYLAQFIDTSRANLWAVNLGMSRKDGAINPYWNIYIEKATTLGLKLLSWNIWNREHLGGSIGNMTAMFPIEHEWIFIFGERQKEINRTRANKHGGEIGKSTIRQKSGETTPSDWVIHADGKMGTVITCDYERGKKDHPAMFPIELSSEYVEACTDDSEIVYDPFLGSGTTLIACERLRRKCRAVEISPAYCAVAIQRWADMTGGEPELVSE